MKVRTLVQTAVGVSLIGTGGLYCCRWYLQDKILNSTAYRTALDYLYNNADAMDLMGRPVLAHKVDVGDDNCYNYKDNMGFVKVPLQGQKKKGFLHYWVKIEENRSFLSNVHLEINGYKQKVQLKSDADQLLED